MRLHESHDPRAGRVVARPIVAHATNGRCLALHRKPAPRVLRPREDDETGGDYIAADGSDPEPCSGDTSMAHGYPRERYCDQACNDDGSPCEHTDHDCNCLFCE